MPSGPANRKKPRHSNHRCVDMVSREAVLFALKRSLLEYALRHHIDSVVANFALDRRSKFSSYGLPSIRFELYNLYKTVKDRQSHRYNGLIEFLVEFNEHFPTIIPEKLYLRVLTSLKALYIYECLRSNDIKKTSSLIKEYFPLETADGSHDKENDNAYKTNFEMKILKLRLQWNELILNRAKRNLFFEKQFHVQYDHEFLNFLFNKTLIIIDHINSHLPKTLIDQMIDSHFKGVCKVLFDKDCVEMELEDEVRFQLYIDHIKLHQAELAASKSGGAQKPRSSRAEAESSTGGHRYLKKLFKLFTQWRIQLDQTETSIPDTCMTEAYSQQATEGAASIIHEILYLDSQFDQFQIQCNQTGVGNEDDDEMEEEEEEENEEPSGADPNASSLITNDTGSSKEQQTSLTDVTRLRMSITDTSDLNAAAKSLPAGAIASDLITDDERDVNTSY